MGDKYETLRLEIRDYIRPEYSCKVGDMVNSIEHIANSTLDLVNNLLTVKVHTEMVSVNDIMKN